MNKLIQVTQNENQEPCVSGRELHKFLEVKTKYADWFSRMSEYGFDENVDFSVIPIFENDDTAFGGKRKSTDHMIKLDMAKELAMIQRTEKGKQARQYFIQVEKEYNSPEKIMARALMIAERELSTLRLENKEQKEQITEMKPKVSYYDTVLQSDSLVTVTDIAKDYGMSATKFNKLLNDLGVQYKKSKKWYLYAEYTKEGYTQSKTIIIKNKEEKTTFTKVYTCWTQKGRLFLYNLLKDNGYIPVAEMEMGNIIA